MAISRMSDPNGRLRSQRRRVLFSLAVFAAGCQRPASHTELAHKIVYLGSAAEATDKAFQGFAQQLREKHPEIATRSVVRYQLTPPGSDDAGRAAALAQALACRPDVLVAPTAASALAARRHAQGTPVVFASYKDPVIEGIATAELPRPVPITGVSLADQLHRKRLEILLDAFPSARGIGVIADRSWFDAAVEWRLVSEQAALQGVSLLPLAADQAEELHRLMHSRAAQGVDALYVPATFLSYQHEMEIIVQASRLRLPAIHSTVQEVRNGALMAYAQDTSFAFEAMADLVARICSGENPAAIPIERPRRFILAVRPRAEPVPLRLPSAIVKRADYIL